MPPASQAGRGRGPCFIGWTCHTRFVAEDVDSPFARVPSSNAGPRPLQDGPFTYERMVTSTGIGSVEGITRWQKYVLGVIFVGLAATVVVLLLAR
jgi:hypothetical protein